MSNKAKKQKKTVVINTKSWGRGNYISDCGKCCALGFAYRQLVDPNITNSQCYKTLLQNGLDNITIEYKGTTLGIPDINDDIKDYKLRRNLLKKLFKKAGFRLLFK